MRKVISMVTNAIWHRKKLVLFASSAALIALAQLIPVSVFADSSLNKNVKITSNTSYSSVAGKVKVYPTNNDALPVALDASKKPSYLAATFTSSRPACGNRCGFEVSYIVKKKKNEFELNNTSNTEVYVTDTQHTIVAGHSDLTTYIHGIKTVTHNVKVRLYITIGTHAIPGHIVLSIYNPGVDPICGTPTYNISDDISASNWTLKIEGATGVALPTCIQTGGSNMSSTDLAVGASWT